MLEVEVKAHVSNFEEIQDKLSQIGATELKAEHQKDTYFNAPHKDYAQTDEALRIREIPANLGSSQYPGEFNPQYILTYKGPKLDDSSKTRKEVEIKIDDVKNTTSLLESLGFRPVQVVEKDRTTYLYDNYLITLDEVHLVGKYVEIERGMVEGEDYQEVLDEIFSIYRKLGIEDGFERRSYLELLEQ